MILKNYTTDLWNEVSCELKWRFFAVHEIKYGVPELFFYQAPSRCHEEK